MPSAPFPLPLPPSHDDDDLAWYTLPSKQKTKNKHKVDLSQCEGRILRIARGSGTHPDEVRGLLKLHKHFEKVFGKVGKNMKGEASKVKQLQVRVCCVFVRVLCITAVRVLYCPCRVDVIRDRGRGASFSFFRKVTVAPPAPVRPARRRSPIHFFCALLWSSPSLPFPLLRNPLSETRPWRSST